MEDRITISAQLAEVVAACQFVEKFAGQAGLDDRTVHHCQLACDEACTNIIEHGYGHEGGNQVIEVACTCESQRFTIVIFDDGPPFDPLTQKTPDPQADLADRVPGGWGMYFMTTLMDDVIYERHDGRNKLTLIKFLAQ